MPAREDDLLAQRAEHFHRKSFVTDRQVETALIAESGGDDGFFIQGCDDAAIDVLWRAGFRCIDPMLQHFEGQWHMIGAQLIGVRDADPQVRIGADNL